MGDEHGIRRRLHLRWSFLAVVARSRVEGRVLLDLVYLRVFRQLHIAVQEGVSDHPSTLTHISLDLNRGLHRRFFRLEDMAFVHEPNEAMKTGRNLDQLGLVPALFLCKSGQNRVRWFKVVG